MKFPTSRIATLNGMPTIVVDGEPVRGMAFCLGSLRGSADYVSRLAADAGMRLWIPCIDLQWDGFADSADNFTNLDYIYAADSQAWVIPRFKITPPPSWYEQHPDECAVRGNSFAKARTTYYSVAGREWLAGAQRTIRDLIDRLNDHPMGARIIGLFTGVNACAESGGWPTFTEREAYDFSPADRQAFAEFLQDKYDDDFERFKALAHQPQWSSWDDVTAPEFEERQKGDCGMFHDPARGGVYIREYRIYESWNVARRLGELADAAKEHSQGRLLFGVFHGYCGSECAGPGNDLMHSLRHPHIDFLAAPLMYDDRDRGGSIAHNMPINSILAHGKVFISECDVRTSLSERSQRQHGAPKTLADSCNSMHLFIGECLANRSYGWYFEPGSNREQWYDHPQLTKCMRALDAHFGTIAATPAEPVADVAIVWDKSGGLDMTYGMQDDNVGFHRSAPGATLIEDMLRLEVPRIGAVVTSVLLEDLIDDRVPDGIKLFIFVNAFGLTSEQRRGIGAVLERRSATELWLYVAGYIDRTENRFSPEAMRELTGMRVAVRERWSPLLVDLTEAGRERFAGIRQPVGQPYRYRTTGLGLRSSFTPTPPRQDYYGPQFVVDDDPGTTVLGTYTDSAEAGFACTAAGGRRRYFLGSPFAACDLLRTLAATAGAHLYADTGDVVYANSRFLIFHASETGPKVLRLPQPSRVTDDSGETTAGIDCLEFDATRGDTRFFFLNP